MFKCLIISLIPFAYQAASYKTKCADESIEKVKLFADTYEGEVHYMANCYNYDFNDENSCPEAINETYEKGPGKKCKKTGETTKDNEKVIEYSCGTRARLDGWYDKLSKNKWHCYKSAVA